MKHIECPDSRCGQLLFPAVEGFPDATYTEICPFCWATYSYRVVNGKAEPWESPKGTNQAFNGVGKPGGK